MNNPVAEFVVAPHSHALGSAPLALRGRDLGFGYESAAAPIFSGINIDVHQQEIVCLLGASGCGKSTLLRTLAGLQPPTRGQVEFLGKPLTQPHPRAAVVFQQASLLPWLSVRDNVAFGLDFKHQPALQEHILQQRVAQAIEAVGLKGKEALRPAQLSGGMAQRVALARALAREPLLRAGDAHAQAETRGDDVPVRIGYLPITDATPLLVAHSQKLFEAEGLRTEKPRIWKAMWTSCKSSTRALSRRIWSMTASSGRHCNRWAG